MILCTSVYIHTCESVCVWERQRQHYWWAQPTTLNLKMPQKFGYLKSESKYYRSGSISLYYICSSNPLGQQAQILCPAWANQEAQRSDIFSGENLKNNATHTVWDLQQGSGNQAVAPDHSASFASEPMVVQTQQFYFLGFIKMCFLFWCAGGLYVQNHMTFALNGPQNSKRIYWICHNESVVGYQYCLPFISIRDYTITQIIIRGKIWFLS